MEAHYALAMQDSEGTERCAKMWTSVSTVYAMNMHFVVTQLALIYAFVTTGMKEMVSTAVTLMSANLFHVTLMLTVVIVLDRTAAHVIVGTQGMEHTV